MLTHRFSAIALLQKAPITASSKNVPDSRCSLMAKLLFLSNKTFQMHIFENIHITKSYTIKFW